MSEDESTAGTVRFRKPELDRVPSMDFSIGESNSDDAGNEDSPRKPSRISINDNLTIITDNTELLSEVEDSPDSPTHPPSDLLISPPGFFEYLWVELTRGYSLDNDQIRYTEKKRKVYAFLQIPYELEKFLFFGFLQCIDAFCYLFTFLPIRFLMSIAGFVLRLRSWTSAETCDVIKVFIIIFSSLMMMQCDTSVIYHQIRGQGTIKLYIFYNMLEVADKLFSSFGQDILEALFWTANEKKTVRNALVTICHFIFALVYVSVHTFLILLQATTLNVAFNSHTQAILTILISNNFVELKGSVFKKFAKANLFQMACSDVRERFHIMALLFVVMVRNMMAVHSSIDQFWDMVPDIGMVLLSELGVDWLKHAFITKFNEINAEVYRDFTLTIAYDVVRSRESSAFSDYSDQVARRMGFIPIPLTVLFIRILCQSVTLHNRASIVICVLAWLLLLLLKVCNGILMLGRACVHVQEYNNLKARAEYELYRKRMVAKKSKSAPSSPRESLIDFSDVLHQTAGVGGFTLSDVMSQMEDLQQSSYINSTAGHLGERRSSERDRGDERTPRRTQSLANIPRARRDKSEPPPSIPEVDEKSTREEVTAEKVENTNQSSPKKRVTPPADCEGLADVTAYTMPEQGIERIT